MILLQTWSSHWPWELTCDFPLCCINLWASLQQAARLCMISLISRFCFLPYSSTYLGLPAIFLKWTKLKMASDPLQICCAIIKKSLPLNLCLVLSLLSFRYQIKCPASESASLANSSKMSKSVPITTICLIFLQNRYHFGFPPLDCELQARGSFVIFLSCRGLSCLC